MTNLITEPKRRTRVFVTSLATAIVAMALPLAGSLSGAASSEQSQPASAEVKIDNFNFGTVALTVAVGTTVTWTNRDDIPHTIVSTNGAFKSKVLGKDEQFSYRFAKAGTFPYVCSIHPKMTGKVVVR